MKIQKIKLSSYIALGILLGSLLFGQIITVDSTKNDVVYTGVQYLFFNNLNPLLADRDVRVAISHAIDRDFIVNNILEGQTTKPASIPVAPSVPSVEGAAHLPARSFDTYKSASLLDKADYPFSNDPLNPNMHFLVPKSNPFRVIWAEMIVDELNNLGMAIELHIVDWEYILPRTFGHQALYDNDPSTTIPTYDGGGYDALFVGLGYDPAKDAIESLYNTFYSLSVDNFAQYSNTMLDTLMESQYLRFLDGEKTNSNNIAVLLYLDEPIAPIVYLA